MLTLEDVSVCFGPVRAVDHVSLQVLEGEVVCLLGASGSGKSTLLRVIAGLERPSDGRVLIDGVPVAAPGVFVEPEERRVGMVFQDYALFPHLTVAQNAVFGVRKGAHAAAEILERFGLSKYANAYPHQLSGGEQQRLALARALAPQPRILLMDEPFSSLDSRLREDVRRYTLEFVRASRTTTVIVTHDPDEALRIADRIALLDGGRLLQYASPHEIYTRPSSLAVARFFSEVAEVRGTTRDGRIETPLGEFPAQQLASGESGVACIRPEHLQIAAQPTNLAARVVRSEFCGERQRVLVLIDGMQTPVALRTTQPEPMEPGTRVYLEIRRTGIPVVASH